MVTPWTIAWQAFLSMESSRQEYWSGLPFPSPGYLPHPGIEPGSPALQVDSLPTEPPRKPWAAKYIYIYMGDNFTFSVASITKVKKWTFDPGIEPRSPALQADSLPSEPPGVLEPPCREPWCSSPCPGWLCCRCSLLQVLCWKKQRSHGPVAWMVGSDGSKCGWPDPPCPRVPSDEIMAMHTELRALDRQKVGRTQGEWSQTSPLSERLTFPFHVFSLIPISHPGPESGSSPSCSSDRSLVVPKPHNPWEGSP